MRTPSRSDHDLSCGRVCGGYRWRSLAVVAGVAKPVGNIRTAGFLCHTSKIHLGIFSGKIFHTPRCRALPEWVCRGEKSSNESLKIQGTSLGPTVALTCSLCRLPSSLSLPYIDASRFGSKYLSKLGFDHTDKNATLGVSGVGLTQHLKVRCFTFLCE